MKDFVVDNICEQFFNSSFDNKIIAVPMEPVSLHYVNKSKQLYYNK